MHTFRSTAEDKKLDNSEAGVAAYPSACFFMRRRQLDIRRVLLYYCCMKVNFDGESVRKCVKRKRLYDRINIALLALLIALAVAGAVCSHYLDGVDVWLFIVLGALLAGIVIYNIAVVARAGRAVRREVAQVVAEAFYAEEDFLRGDGEMAFGVYYEGDLLTVKRADYVGRIAVDPRAIKDGARLSQIGAEICFDLKGLKKLSSVYSDMGSYIWEFLQAYYSVNFVKGRYTSVRVTDYTTKKPFELTIIDGGDLFGTGKSNYYVKTGLIK